MTEENLENVYAFRTDNNLREDLEMLKKYLKCSTTSDTVRYAIKLAVDLKIKKEGVKV